MFVDTASSKGGAPRELRNEPWIIDEDEAFAHPVVMGDDQRVVL